MSNLSANKTGGPKWTFLVLIFAILASLLLQAEDRNGLLFNVTKKTVSREDQRGFFTHEIDRDLILKAVIKNISMKDMEAGTAEFVILIQRWGSETGALERHAGTVEIPALKKAQEAELKTSNFHIGGHLHGTSTRHLDQMEAWKFTINIGGKKTEFKNSGSFDALDKRAVAAAG